MWTRIALLSGLWMLATIPMASAQLRDGESNAQAANQAQINRLLRGIANADGNTLPEWISQINELAPSLERERVQQLQLAATSQGMRIKQFELVKLLSKQMMLETDAQTHRNVWRQALTYHITAIQQLEGDDVSWNRLLELEPEVGDIYRHASWAMLVAAHDEEGQGPEILRHEISVIAGSGRNRRDPALMDMILELQIARARLAPADLAETLWQELAVASQQTLDSGVEDAALQQQLIEAWFAARTNQLNLMAENAPDQVKPLLQAAFQENRELTAKVSPVVKRNLANMEKSLQQLSTKIEATIYRNELLGQLAPELEVDAAVGGQPVNLSSLRGRVVLLDFWAVWCGPCVATFPHMRHLHEQYARQGLVVLGMTNYHGMEWSDEEEGPVRAEDASREAELDMLERFVQQHQLPYRTIVAPKGNENNEAYRVNGIPHVVLIDRSGRIQMIRVGASPQNAKALEDKIRELL